MPLFAFSLAAFRHAAMMMLLMLAAAAILMPCCLSMLIAAVFRHYACMLRFRLLPPPPCFHADADIFALFIILLLIYHTPVYAARCCALPLRHAHIRFRTYTDVTLQQYAIIFLHFALIFYAMLMRFSIITPPPLFTPCLFAPYAAMAESAL